MEKDNKNKKNNSKDNTSTKNNNSTKKSTSTKKNITTKKSTNTKKNTSTKTIISTKKNTSKKKNKKEKKGMSMVELLAVIVIIGIIGTIGITSISRILDRSRQHFYDNQQEQLVLAAQSYANDHKYILPKTIGGFSTIYLQDLYDENYIKEKIVDQNQRPCYPNKTETSTGDIIEGSRVEIYKSSKNEYKYIGYLECEACKKEYGNEDSTCYDKTKRVEPEIEINIPDVSSKSNTILNANHEITITLKGNKTNNNIKISSYSYKIYVNGVIKQSSGLKINNKQSTVVIKDKLYKYVPGDVKVIVTATNSDGLSKTKSFKRNLNDAKAPLCGKVSYEKNNTMNSYNSGETKNCGADGYPWINIGNTTGSRQAWVLCNDELGLGCAQHEYSVNMTTDGHNESVAMKDKNGNTQTCSVKKCIDKTSPKLTVNIKSGGTVKKTFTVDSQKASVNYSKSDKYDTWLNKTNYPNGVTVEIKIEDSTSKVKSLTWYQNPKEKKENNEGSATEKVLEKNNINQESFTTSNLIKDDGVRKEVFTVYDNAGNRVVYTLILKIDRTAPPKPKMEMYLEDTASATSKNTKYTNDTWKNKYVWIDTDHPTDSPNVSGWKTNRYKIGGKETNVSDKVGNNAHVSKEGTSTITFQACDNADNCSAYQTANTIKLDRTIKIPTTNLRKWKNNNTQPSSASGLSAYANNTWYSGKVFTYPSGSTESGDVSGLKEYQYTTTGKTSNKSNESASYRNIEAQGISYIKWRAVDKAGNVSGYNTISTIKLDRKKPSCSITKTNTNTTAGVTLTTSCKDDPADGAGNSSGVKTCESRHTGVKSSKTYTVVDNANNSDTCSKTVSSKRQRKDCSSCNRCSAAGCKTVHYSTKVSYHTDYAGSGRACRTVPLPNCGISNAANTNTLCCKSETKYANGCDQYYSSCSKCNCGSWGSWYDVSSCSSSSSVSCRTLYY